MKKLFLVCIVALLLCQVVSAWEQIPGNGIRASNYTENAAVNISYKVEKSGHVELKLYNINGREVATLVSEERQIGANEIQFDASNLASGTYFLKLDNGVNSYSSKISFTK